MALNGPLWRDPLPPTKDELQVLGLLVTGMTDERTAASLGVTERTVRSRLHNAMQKLGARSRIQAGFLLAQAGWLDEQQQWH